MKKQISKIISWTLLILTIVSVVLVFWPPAGVQEASNAGAARSFDRKLAKLAETHQRGEPSQARFAEIEVNSKVQQIFNGASSAGLASVTGVAINLHQYDLVSVLAVKIFGLPLYITLGGKPSLNGHQLQFDLDDVKLGRMPAPASAFSVALKAKLSSPEGQDMMRMPDFISGVRVENRELVIDSQ